MINAKIIGHRTFLFILLGLIFLTMIGVWKGTSSEKILYQSFFHDLKQNWEVWDDPEATSKIKKSIWKSGLAELSGIKNRDKKIATAVIAGESSWSNYSLETTLLNDGSRGNLTGFLFGYQDQEHFYHAGYNFELSRFELEVRTPDGYNLITYHEVKFPEKEDISLKLDFAGNRIRLSTNQAKVLDILDGTYTSGRFGLGTSNLGGAKVLFGPVTVKSLNPASIPPLSIRDLLQAARGATVISGSDKQMMTRLINHEYTIDGKGEDDRSKLFLNTSKIPLPIEGVFAFPQNRTVKIQKIGLKLSQRNFPESIEFLVSTQGTETGFHSIGAFTVKPESDSYQEFLFDNIPAKYINMRVLSITDNKNNLVELMELFCYGVYDQDKESAHTEALGATESKILFQDDFSSGNLDKWQVWDDPAGNPKKSQWQPVLTDYSMIKNQVDKPATLLLTGEKHWTSYSVLTEFYAASHSGQLTGIVFGYQDSDHYYISGYNFVLNQYEVLAKTPQGFELLARAEIALPRGKFLPLRVDFFNDRIRLLMEDQLIFDIDDPLFSTGRVGIGSSGLTNGQMVLKGFQIKNLTEENLPPRELQDLLAYRRGAAVIYRTAPPKREAFKDAIDHLIDGSDKFGNYYELDLTRAKLPEEAVFCFPEERFVEIHKIGFNFSRKPFLQEVELFVSDQTPKSGFKPLITLSLKPEERSYQEFSVPPTRSKYLKIRLTKSTGPKSLNLNEIYIKGYFLEKARLWSGEDLSEKIRIQEKESNDSAADAQTLPLNTYLGGKADFKDRDFFLIDLSGHSGNTLTLSLETGTIVKPDLELQAKDGSLLKPDSTVSQGGKQTFTFSVQSDIYYLQLSRPEANLAIVYDDSGSMRKSVEIVRKTLSNYLDNLDEGLKLRLIKYTDKPEYLTDFTSDISLLKEALKTKVGGGGSTDTFEGLLGAVKSVATQKGTRAVLSIFDVLACSNKCLEKYTELWNGVLDNGISFSTIGVQKNWERRSNYYGLTQEQIFKELAYASGGQFFLTPKETAIEESANQIFTQLTSPVDYLIRADLKQTEKKAGSIEVLFTPGNEKQASKNVELILDASNSMWGQIQGEAKITIAKKVLDQIITGLPDGMNVGLRVYGHRYNLKDNRACTDSEILIPIKRLEKDRMISAIQSIQPRGKTPLVYSVLEGIKDFSNLEGGTLVLISDGVESCNGDINSIAPVVKDAGLDLQVNIVGFDIKEEAARMQLEAIARSTGGTYLDARDTEGLQASLEQTLKIEYVLIDNQGEVVARGNVGGHSVEVIEGTYTLRLMVAPSPIEVKVVILPEKSKKFLLTKDGEKWNLQDKK